MMLIYSGEARGSSPDELIAAARSKTLKFFGTFEGVAIEFGGVYEISDYYGVVGQYRMDFEAQREVMG